MPSLTFSITVHQGNSAFSWNTKAMSWGRGPRTGLLLTSTVPELCASNPPIMLSSVLLPQPLGPIRHRSSPRVMSSEVFSSARTNCGSPGSPNWCETSLILTAASPGVILPDVLSLNSSCCHARRSAPSPACGGGWGRGLQSSSNLRHAPSLSPPPQAGEGTTRAALFVLRRSSLRRFAALCFGFPRARS